MISRCYSQSQSPSVMYGQIAWLFIIAILFLDELFIYLLRRVMSSDILVKENHVYVSKALKHMSA